MTDSFSYFFNPIKYMHTEVVTGDGDDRSCKLFMTMDTYLHAGSEV